MKNTGIVIGVLGMRQPRLRGVFLGIPFASQTTPSRAVNAPSFFTSKAWNWTLNLIIFFSFTATTFWFGPRLYFSLFPNTVEPAQAQELQGNFDLEITETSFEVKPIETPTEETYLPEYNENLPEGNWFIIPRIGVRSQLQSGEDWEEALKTGLWLASGFGQPGDQKLPMIVAGHRFGFDWWWQDDYWKYHSFYSLPELEPGDTIEVISGQRKWVYEVYDGEEGPEITDYQADMVVYTCKHLESPIRIFRYARLVIPGK